MSNTFIVILISFVLGFVLYQVQPIQSIFRDSSLSAMFQIANFIILIVILDLLLKKRSE